MKFIKNNSLSLVFFLLFVCTIIGQIFFGLQEYNKVRTAEGLDHIECITYFSTGHFIESTFENWESEFLQMALFVLLTIFLQQKGSSESKNFDIDSEVDRKPSPNGKDAPWPVKKGGLILAFYQHSLTIALMFLFIVSFVLHFYGSLKDENEQLLMHNKPIENASTYICDSRFWFESFQNWQSEFLSVFAIVILSVFLRQKGSPQSKPVDAPDSETGE